MSSDPQLGLSRASARLNLPSKDRPPEEKLAEICRKNDIVFMAIFGSFIRGEQSGKSDIDIADLKLLEQVDATQQNLAARR
jgi:predicted nucleotidyltransferase